LKLVLNLRKRIQPPSFLAFHLLLYMVNLSELGNYIRFFLFYFIFNLLIFILVELLDHVPERHPVIWVYLVDTFSGNLPVVTFKCLF